MNHLHHLTLDVESMVNPQVALYYIREEAQNLAQNDPALCEFLWDVNELVNAAMCTYCGLFPTERPYHYWGGAIHLPWYGDFFESDKNGNVIGVRRIPELEIAELFALFCDDPEYLDEPPHDWVLSDDSSGKTLVQASAFQIVLCLDGSVEHLLRNRGAESVRWATTAYRNLIDLTMYISREFAHL